MSEETTQTQASQASEAASNTAGENGARRPSARPYGSQGAAGGGDMGAAMTGEPRFRGRRRRKVSYLTINKIQTVDYKEVNILRRFTNDRGKILSAKFTGNTAKQQRMIAQAIRRAREMALMPFVVTEFSAERPMRPRPPRNYDRDNREHREPREPRNED